MGFSRIDLHTRGSASPAPRSPRLTSSPCACGAVSARVVGRSFGKAQDWLPAFNW